MKKQNFNEKKNNFKETMDNIELINLYAETWSALDAYDKKISKNEMIEKRQEK